jgi:hypothetical protein
VPAERNERPISSPVQPCPSKHWIDVRLRFRPEAKARPVGWPVERLPGYRHTNVSVTAAGVAPPLRTLDDDGRVRVDDIPAGSAQVVFYDLLAKAEEQMKAGRTYA